jgi:hypothetical protein
MYASDYSHSDLPYLMLYTEKRLGGPTLPSLVPNTKITFPYRTVMFHGNTSQAIVIYMPPNGCLRVLDPARGDAETYGKESHFLVDAIPLSDPSRIVTETSSPAQPEFISEPEHDWCYYFTKAELAYQEGFFEKVVELGDEAISRGYQTDNPSEWLVFIEASAMTGDFETAEKLSGMAFSFDRNARVNRGLCVVWKRIQANGPVGSEEKGQNMLSQFNCNP